MKKVNSGEVDISVKFSFFVLYLLILLVVFIKNINIPYEIEINKIVQFDIIADSDIKYVDEYESSKNEELIKLTTPGIYEYEYKRNNQIINYITNVIIDYQVNDYENIKSDYKLFNKIDFLKIKEVLKKIDIKNFEKRLVEFYEVGLIILNSVDLSKVEYSGVRIIKRIEDKTIDILYTYEEVSELFLNFKRVQKTFNSIFQYLDEEEKNVFYNFLSKVLMPNIVYNNELSEKNLKKRLETEKNVYKTIYKGQIVARKGDLINNENISKIKAVLNLRKKNININYFISNSVLLFMVVLLLYLFINKYEKNILLNKVNIFFILIIILLYSIYVSLPFGFSNFDISIGLIVPISAFILTFYYLFSNLVSIIVLVTMVLIFVVINGGNSSFVFIILSGFFSFFTINRNYTKRVDLLLSGLYIAIFNVIISLSLINLNSIDIYNVFKIFSLAFFNGVLSSVFAIGLIALGEIILNTPTVFRLQELTDTSSKLLKELFDNAVGTYSHSINVSNLAEKAAIEINANGLLAKVGGLYHDIGKIENSDYFIENQKDYNIHNELKPIVSANIIKKHVQNGVELALQHKLPKQVIDIIKQHHGNSLIKYFYEKALSEKKDDEFVNEESFRYNCENPQFPEAAIVMLSDQVEAIARLKKNITPEELEKLIDKIFDERFFEGILDDSGLTLKDLTKIKKVFIKTILGTFHSRIEYNNSNNQKENKV